MIKSVRIFGLLMILALLTLNVGAAGPNLSVDVSQDRAAIDPLIYGMNFVDPALGAELALPLNRWGGNDTSRYNYLLDTSAKGMDYFFSVIPYSADGANLPEDSTVDRYIRQNAAWGGQTIITVPLIGWTPKAADIHLCGFPKSRFPNQQAFEPWREECGNGKYPDGTPITNPVATDSSAPITTQFVTNWVAYLVNRYGGANGGGVRLYALDNEPHLWNDTHRDIRLTGLGYDEHRDLSLAYAAAVKAADPNALVMGPSDYGWEAYFFSALDRQLGGEFWWNNPQDRLAHGNIPFIEWYLQQFQAYETANGIRLLDYLDEHFYPQNGVSLNEDVSPVTAALRLRSTRALWDPTYIDETYIGEAVKLIPRMKQWVAAHYPGTKIAITEYNWGGMSDINGALAQADILGIFGREGLDLATIWEPPSSAQPGAYAFRMYLNYDGLGGKFGDTRVRAVSADQSILSVYAAQRSSDGAITMMVINKSGADQTDVALSLAGVTPQANAEVWRYSSANLSQIIQSGVGVSASGFTMTYPANSITLVVVCPVGSPCDGGGPTPTPIPSVTPEPSATPEPSNVELLSNIEFINGETCTLTGWVFNNPTGDKLVGTTLKPKGAFDKCAVLFTGTAGSTVKLTTQASVTGLQVGDVLRVSAWLRGQNISSGGALIATLTYPGGVKTKIRVPVRAGSYPYEFQGESATLTDLPTKITVMVQMRSGSGKFFADNIHLMVNPTSRLELPSVP